MNKEAIIDSIEHAYQNLIDCIEGLDEHAFLLAAEGKWSAGKQLDHMIKSVAPVNMAMGLPNFIPALLFGKANRPSKTYEELVAKYQSKLAAGGKAPAQFVPPFIPFEAKTKLINRLKNLVKALCKKINRQSEEALDKNILPHPLLGKLTLREMLYFTIYHAAHHQASIEQAITLNDPEQS
jgi:hypothetical protein